MIFAFELGVGVGAYLVVLICWVALRRPFYQDSDPSE